MRRTLCSACGYDGLEIFLDLGLSPLADEYSIVPNAVMDTHPLQLAVCTGCHLVQLMDVVEHDRLFGAGYSFYSSASQPLSAYHAQYADDVLRLHGELAKRFTLEVGCNDGDMLRHFDQAGCKTLGVDPAVGPASSAQDRGLEVWIQAFDGTVASRIVEERGPAGIVIANHVLAHADNVASLLGGIQVALDHDGIAFVEVQYLSDLLINNAFDLVYHEHRHFFSLTSLAAAAAQWGLHVVSAQLTDRQGGSIRVALAKHREPHGERDRISASEGWLRGMEAYRGFQGRADRIRDRLHELLQRLDGPIVGYGAPAKATTLLHFCQIDDALECVVDTTVAKQGRYVPGTSVPILAPESVELGGVRALLLLAWNYAPQIMRNHLDYTARGGHWVLPIPSPVLL